MNTLSDEKTKDIMLKLYPNQTPNKTSNSQRDEERVSVRQQLPHFRPNSSAPPFMAQQIKKTSTVSKKWYISLALAGLSVLLFSSFSLNFLDDICSRKNIEAFDKKGDPNPLLLLILFTFLVIVSRTLFMFL